MEYYGVETHTHTKSTEASKNSTRLTEGFSIFAMTWGGKGLPGSYSLMSLLISTMSSGLCTNDSATQSTPMPSMYSKSARSFGVRQLIFRIESGVLTVSCFFLGEYYCMCLGER